MKQPKKTTRAFAAYGTLSPGQRVTDLYFQSLARLRSTQEGSETWVSEMYETDIVKPPPQFCLSVLQGCQNALDRCNRVLAFLNDEILDLWAGQQFFSLWTQKSLVCRDTAPPPHNRVSAPT